MFDLSGKVAIVTGGNGGIGLGVARGLASAGASVAVWGRNRAKNQAAVDELVEMGAPAEAVTCDVAEESSVEAAMVATLERFGRIDSVFANAGLGSRNTRFAEMSLEEWREILSVNLDGVFLTFRAAVRQLLEQGEGGSLVVTSSISSRFGMPRGEHYAASKAAVNAVVRGLAVEHGKHGIRANAIVPGWVETEMTEEAFSNPRFAERVQPRIPVGRWGRPEDFAGIAVYLASDASRWHTGDTITIDGGYACF